MKYTFIVTGSITTQETIKAETLEELGLSPDEFLTKLSEEVKGDLQLIATQDTVGTTTQGRFEEHE